MTENPEKRPMVPPTRPRAPSMVKARSYSIWSYVALPIPTNTTWRLYGKSRSEKTILKDLLICSHPLLLRLHQKQCFSALAACSSNSSLGVSPAWGRLQCLPHRSTSYLAETLNSTQTPNTHVNTETFQYLHEVQCKELDSQSYSWPNLCSR